MKNTIYQSANNRVQSLDWLRGLMAVTVMCYHLTLWTCFPLDSGSILGRLGIYAVSIFFVLSGLSMVIVYHSFFNSWKQVLIFWFRRIFRIWPLLWLCIGLTIINPNFEINSMDLENLISTASTAFAFLYPSKYFLTGAWSIGNEMVYYSITPLVFLIFRYGRNWGNLVLISTFLLALFFSLNLLSSEISLAKQWAIYVNPWNNVFFYVLGIGMYYFFENRLISKLTAIMCVLLAVILLVLLPSTGNQINIVTGWNRIGFSIFTFLLVLGFYKNSVQLPSLLTRLLNLLGESTYGIYLLHPIIYSYVGIIAKKMGLISSPFLFISTVILTILLAYISYHFFEKPFIQLGKKWSKF